jgi:hypothetical protein
MKKLFVFASSLAVVLLVGFACKKSTTTTTPATTSTSSTTGSTTSVSTNTTTINFTDNGTASQNATASGLVYGSSYYAVTMLNGNSNYTPTIQLTFPGATSPASGSYIITNGTSPTAGHCGLLLSNVNGSAVASSGTVTVVAATSTATTSDAYFTNIVCTGTAAGTHTVTGNIKW